MRNDVGGQWRPDHLSNRARTRDSRSAEMALHMRRLGLSPRAERKPHLQARCRVAGVFAARGVIGVTFDPTGLVLCPGAYGHAVGRRPASTHLPVLHGYAPGMAESLPPAPGRARLGGSGPAANSSDRAGASPPRGGAVWSGPRVSRPPLRT